MSGQNNKTVCDYNEFRRPRYFHGMLLEDRDFKDEQDYHAAKRRMLNRTLHGSGVVCGLELEAVPDSKEIRITAGLALDCCGNEIWVGRDLKLDLSKLLKTQSSQDAACPSDDQAEVNVRYVVIEYRETAVDPVSVYVPGGGCDQRTCEHSRTREGYCVRLVKNCPQDMSGDGLLKRFCECATKGGTDKKPEKGCLNCDGLDDDPEKLCQCYYLGKFCDQSVPCPSCGRGGEHEYVVLGRIELDEDCERIQHLCMNDCRRYVLTGRLLQHLIVSTLAGAGGHIGVLGSEEKLPDGVKIAQNPIWALCWYLRYFVITPGEWEVKECKKPDGGGGAGTGDPIQRRIQEVVERERSEAAGRLEAMRQQFDERLNSIEKRLP